MAISVDVAVIGAGAAGLSAARAAHGRGASVALIEGTRLGGDCTWTGCVPSKALLHQAHDIATARRVGFDGEVDAAAIFATVRERIAKVAGEEDRPTLEAAGIRVVEGIAQFVGPDLLDVDGTGVRAGTVVVATGSSALFPPIPGLAAASTVTNETVFDLTELPKRLAVLGGGPIGLELGQAFARLGSTVTIFEMEPRLAVSEEPEASAVLLSLLRREGVDVRLGAPVTRVEPGPPARVVTDGPSPPAEVDLILVATGRVPNTKGMNLEGVGVRLDERGHIEVDDRLRTSTENVYAVGDVVADSAFTHTGDEMGRIAVANALGRVPRRWSSRAVPLAIYTDPELGRAGMTEQAAFAAYGPRARVAYFPLADTDRAKTAGVSEGFVKLIAAPHPIVRGLFGGQLVGATVVAPTGGDMVHELALAVQSRTIVGRIAQTIHAYPSWSLAIREAATQFFTEHKGRRARPAREAQER
jgi:pyruvate/2-oxoglutarate dehydrogenase complex dihydrolipoamide dehydrogenase (E3) component